MMIDVERVVTLNELVERVPEGLIRQAELNRAQSELKPASGRSVPPPREDSESSDVNKEPSKAQRIRNYLEAHPGAKNKDVVEALAEFQVKAADVANVKSLSKRTAAKASRAARSDRRPQAAASSSSSTAMTAPHGPHISLPELEAGVAFVKAAGSITRAKHLLIIIEQIKAS
jgi:hypothetical protein